MGTEGQESAAGGHIHYRIDETLPITDDVRAALREGVDLVLAGRRDPEQLSALVTSSREEISRGTPGGRQSPICAA